MNKILQFVKAYRKTILLALGVILMCFAVIAGARALGSAISDRRIDKLETEKQELLKQGAAAHDRDVFLQGQIQAKDQQIKTLTDKVAESDQRVIVAHTETQSARVNYEKVRNSPVHFDSSDDAGRVNELRAVHERLYPDQP